MIRSISHLLLLPVCWMVFFSGKPSTPAQPVDPTCEMQARPMALDVPTPVFGWKLSSQQRNVKQEKYRILVASTLKNLNRDKGDVWDSGWVVSDETLYIPYAGAELQSHGTYYWKVRVETNTGVSKWSESAVWTTGFIDEEEWQAKWIGLDEADGPDRFHLPARYFRNDFMLDAKPVKATLYIAGLGLYEAYINGERIGTQVLSPTPTDYTREIKYNVFDVTETIGKGDNAVGVILGSGRFVAMRRNNRHFGLPMMRLEVRLELKDGSTIVWNSDESWQVTSKGPIGLNNEFDGEDYDATKEMPGWNRPGFTGDGWRPVQLVDAPSGSLMTQINPNIEIMETIAPVAVSELRPGVWIMDMGQNMVGWVKMRLNGTDKRGETVQLRFAETLDGNGDIYVANLRGARATDRYTMKGEQQEVWEPSFVYHGFRYVEITGFPGVPSTDNFEGRVVYDEMETTGYFHTSDETINQIYKNAYWGIRGNYRGMPTDCPQREERMGWLGDRSVGSHGESFMFGNHLLYSKWLDDIGYTQREDGALSCVAPNFWMIYSDNITWPGSYIIIADMLYRQFGDLRPVKSHYESMKKWLEYMRSRYLVDGIMTKDKFGDWCMPPEAPEMIHSLDPGRKTNGEVLASTHYYHLLTLMAKFAGLLDKPEDAEIFERQAVEQMEAFNAKYLDKETGRYDNNTVTANLMPLAFGMVPEEYREAVFANIVDKTMNESGGHVSTGLVGAQWLMRTLSDNGRIDIAMKLATNRTYPSWGYMVESGATTIWELWNGNTASPEMNSANHVMLLGDLIVWYYEYVAGIQNAEGSVAFKKICMKPRAVEYLDHAEASYKSVRGEIASRWEKQGGTLRWTITVPAGTTAVVYVPTADAGSVMENGKKAELSEGIEYVGTEEGYAVYNVVSGSYNFTSKI